MANSTALALSNEHYDHLQLSLVKGEHLKHKAVRIAMCPWGSLEVDLSSRTMSHTPMQLSYDVWKSWIQPFGRMATCQCDSDLVIGKGFVVTDLGR
jgi:hypothetical protein